MTATIALIASLLLGGCGSVAMTAYELEECQWRTKDIRDRKIDQVEIMNETDWKTFEHKYYRC